MQRTHAILIFFLLILAVNTYAITDTNLIAYYNFETGGTTLTDLVGGNNNGTNTDISVSPQGRIGNAYYFNGSTTKSVLTNTGFPTSNFTVAGWFKTSAADNDPFYSQGTRNVNGLYIELENLDPAHRINTLVFNSRIYTAIQADTNAWRFIVVDYNGASVSVLIDNTYYFSKAITGSLSITTPTLGNDTGTAFYTGLMDEMSIWNRILTTQDKNELWNAGAGQTYPFTAPIPKSITLHVYDTNSSANLLNSMDCNTGIFSYTNQVSPYTLDFPDTNKTYACSFTSLGYDSRTVNIYTDVNKTVDVNLDQDFTPPITTGTTTAVSYGFVTDFNIGWTLNCQDEKLKALNYDVNLILNDTNNFNIYHLNAANNLTKSGNYIIPTYAKAKFRFSCTDTAGNVTLQDSNYFYTLLFRLVNENTGANLTASDLNALVAGANVYTYDGNYTYDFNTTGTTSKNFLAPYNNVRFDFTYKDTAATKIGRDIDFSLITDYNLPVCLAPFQTFYEQILVSTSQKPVILFNDAANCYNMSGYTKFIYQNALMIKAYTINKPYYLYTYTGNTKILLALLEGSTASVMNIDAIQLNSQNINLSIINDSLSFKCLENSITHVCDQNIMQIYYKNNAADNTQLNFKIYNGNNLLFNYTDTNNPNDLLINYYYGNVLGLTDQNLLKLVLTKTAATTTTSNYYFTINGDNYNGVLDPVLAVILALLLTMFGLTFVAYRFAMGWFGILVCLIALMILSFAPGFWYVNFFKIIIVIVLILIGIIFKQQQAVIQ
jgi:hypothetical protein